ncbi:MAG: hypothetical protein DRI95_00075 [Bacteroidetes bacterium]|nr:MAG: hypothetical protein DRI95_00075 [Bacteroidota bacterium]
METKKQTLKQIITFFIIISILTIVVFILMFKDGAGHMDPAWTAIMMWMPAIAAIVTSLIYRDKIKNYGWKPGKAKYLGYAYLFPIIIGLIAYGTVWIFGIIELYGDEASDYKWARMLGIETPSPVWVGLLSKITLASLITLLFVSGEEIGWSGFLTPKLLKITTIPKTSIIVGLYWAVWHYPAIIEGGVYGYGEPLWIALPGFTLVLIGLSFLRTYFVSKSKSLWTGTLIHVSHNVITMGIFFDLTVKTEYAAYFVSETGIITGIVCVLVAVTYWKIKSKKTEILIEK